MPAGRRWESAVRQNDIKSDSPLTSVTEVMTERRRCFHAEKAHCTFMNVRKLQEEMKMDALKTISEASMKQEVPAFSIGDTVKVHVRIKEGDKSRIQVFEGTVIAKKHGGISETFTVRRVAHGCGIERVFPLHSPVVDHVDVIRRGKVRRAKLYYLRDRVGKAAKVKEQIR